MLILDTHAWIWWESESSRLSRSQREAIQTEYRIGRIGISAASCWEIAMLVEKGRLELGDEPLHWMRTALNRPGVELIPLTPEIAVSAYQLPASFHADPADRLIVATAIRHSCPLVTSDGRIVESRVVATIV